MCGSTGAGTAGAAAGFELAAALGYDGVEVMVGTDATSQDPDALQALTDHYGVPMEMEWAKDGETGQIFIVQARPETVHAQSKGVVLRRWDIKPTSAPLLEGLAIGGDVAFGHRREVVLGREPAIAGDFPRREGPPAPAGKLRESDQSA